MMKSQAIIVDVDGTLALRMERGPYEWDRVGEDLPNWPIVALVKTLLRAHPTWDALFVSGRDEICRSETEAWLMQNVYGFRRSNLFMRTFQDQRPDDVVKAEIYEQYIAPYWHVLYVLDDRRRVVNMWRGHGLTVLDVAGNEF